MLTTHNIDIQAMLVWLTLPFCGFRSVAVNTVYKLQFFYIYYYYCCCNAVIIIIIKTCVACLVLSITRILRAALTKFRVCV